MDATTIWHPHPAIPNLCPVLPRRVAIAPKRTGTSFRGSGDLPPLISSPVSMGLLGGLAFERENTEVSMGLHDLNRLEIKKGSVLPRA